MSTRDIPKDRWCDELDTFSRQHEGWIVRVDVSGADGTTYTQARDLPLIGVSCDAPQSDRIAIMAGNRVDDHLTHEIASTVSIAIDETEAGAERGLLIRSADGSETRVEFRSPMRTDEVDGMPHP
ncbi:MAG: hypothetical protein DMG03_05815 [Acidobacteria bacterium]|nr:MAG: hypothetical protein DMG03_05815 [Acidobacteriota bacterium]